MSARIITPFSTRQHPLDVSRQEYQLAKENFREVCRLHDATSPEGVRRFRAALERRTEAFDAYMAAMSQ